MKTAPLAALISIGLLLAACGGGGAGGTGAPSDGLPGAGSTLRVSITDAPFPSSFVEEASVVIQEVRVRDKDQDSWVTIYTGSAEIDLVPLTGGVAALLVEATVPPGTYDEVRMIVDAGRVLLGDTAFTATGDPEFTVANGSLKFPSGAQTGIKVKIDNDIVVTSQLSGDLMLDFDLTKSFVFNGPPSHAPGVQRVLFKPVVRATNSSTAGTLQLDVTSDSATPADTADDLPLAGATVRVLDDTDTEVATAMADAQGRASISLDPGTYKITVEAAAHEAATILDVQVALANVTDLGEVRLVVSEAEIKGAVTSDGATPVDTTDDVVLEGATVEVRAAGDTVVVASATTDAQGAFVFDKLAPGAYDLRVSKAGFTTLDVGAVDAAGPGLFTPLDLVLAALTRDVKGTVVDNAAAAVVGATVEIRNAEGSLIGSATTDANGDYAILGIPTGAHTLSVTPAGSATTTTQALTVEGTDPVSDLTADVTLP